MARISVTVCDKCRSQTKPTKKYTVKTDERTASVDLCADDAKPIEELLKTFGTGRTTRGFGAAVKTIEEIEAEKAKARGAAK